MFIKQDYNTNNNKSTVGDVLYPFIADFLQLCDQEHFRTFMSQTVFTFASRAPGM